MKTEIKRSINGDWDLFVDGEKQIESESLTVCQNIEYALKHPGGISECDEVAERVRK
jgi:hypothetical protein